ncbi:MAG: NAD-dependent epimerase/dehydratase family protein [Phycisphaerales bacterium]|nr:NAD-dependent epimerase/dehydratase family protein [Phycisphaerales bacterium]
MFRRRYAGVRALVTGGAGFIGGHLAEALMGLGAGVTILDDLSNSTAAHAAELVQRDPQKCRLVIGSVLDPGALAHAIEGAGVVFHLAAVGSVPLSIEDPERAMAVNATGTVRVAEACRRAGVRRWVYSASSSCYGDDPGLPKTESSPPNPLSPYAASKLAGEHVVRAWQASYGLQGVSLRYFNIFGPRQSPDSAYAAVIAAFAGRLLRGQRTTIFGDGSFSRDFTHVDNAVYANLLAGSVDRDPLGLAVNIGCGVRTTILELHAMVARLAGQEGRQPDFRPVRSGDVPHSQADLTRAQQLLGYRPIRGLEDGLRETVEWFARELSASARPA